METRRARSTAMFPQNGTLRVAAAEVVGKSRNPQPQVHAIQKLKGGDLDFYTTVHSLDHS